MVVPFDHQLFYLCTVPLSLESEPSLPHLSEDHLMWLVRKWEPEQTGSEDQKPSTTGPRVMCVVVPFDHHLFHLCTVPLSLDSEPSLPHLMDRVAAVIPHTVGPSPTRLDGKMVPSFPCLIPIVCPIPNVH